MSAETNLKAALRESMRLNGDIQTKSADERPAMTDRREDTWRFTRSISIGGLAAIVMQSAAVVWWAQGLSKSVDENRRRIETIESQRVAERLTALESQMVDSKGSLIRIEAKLDRLVETRK